MSRNQLPLSKQWTRAMPQVSSARIGRIFVLLALFLSLACPWTAGAEPAPLTPLAEGDISYIGNIGSATIKNSSNNVLQITTGAAVAAGDAIMIAYVSDPYQNLQISVADSAGNTYTEAALAMNTGHTRTYLFVAYDVEALPTGGTITITQSGITGTGPAARAGVASVFRGLAAASALDKTSTGSGNSSTPSSATTATTSFADELLIGVIGTEGPEGDAAGTWENSFTAGLRAGTTGGSDPATDITVGLGRRIVSATGAYTAQKSGITSRYWSAIIATFKSASAPPTPASFNILLGRPTDESVTANIIPDQDVEFYVEYGTSSGSYAGQTPTYSAIADEPIEIVIGGLSADTEYFYRVVSNVMGATAWAEGTESSFDTQKARGEGFTFTIISDSHLGQYGGQTVDEKALYERTISNVGADQPDFHIDLGDTFAMDPSPLGTGMTEAEAEAAYLVQRPFMGLIGDSVPIYLVLGNHENEEGWNFDDVFTAPDQSLARVGMTYRKLYYPNPVPDDFYTGNVDPLPSPIGGDTFHEDYYAWEWGDVLFVVLDPYHYSMIWPAEGGSYGGEGMDGETGGDRWDWSLGIKQYLWLKNTLASSNATYKFVFSHHVTGGSTVYGRGGLGATSYFEWGGRNANGTWGWDTERPASEGWDVPVHQLMVEGGVDVYFHGHDHIYAFEELDGIAYVECAKPDDAGYTWEPYGYGYTENLYPDGYVLPNSGHLRVSVSPAEVTIEYVRSYLPGDGNNGEIGHSHTIVRVDVSASTPSVGVQLTWAHPASVDGYEVRRSLTDPYFEPSSGSLMNGEVTLFGGTATFSDTTADLSIGGNRYFYAVMPLGASGEPMGKSDRSGAFVFDLEPGTISP